VIKNLIRIALLLSILPIFSVFSSAQANYNFNVGGLGFNSGPAVPASCAQDGYKFWLNTGSIAWYTCKAGTYVVDGSGTGGGTVTGVTCGAGLSGGTFTTSGTCAIATGGVTFAMLAAATNFVTIAGTSVSLGTATSSLPSPGAIGSGTPSTGTFTTLQANTQINAGTAGVLAPIIFGNATSGLITLQPGPGAITSYTLDLPIAQPTVGNTFLSCTAANPSVCTFTAGGALPAGSAPQILINQGGTTYTPNSVSGDSTLASNGAMANIGLTFSGAVDIPLGAAPGTGNCLGYNGTNIIGLTCGGSGSLPTGIQGADALNLSGSSTYFASSSARIDATSFCATVNGASTFANGYCTAGVDMWQAITAAIAASTTSTRSVLIDARGFYGTHVIPASSLTQALLGNLSGPNSPGGEIWLGNVRMYIDGPVLSKTSTTSFSFNDGTGNNGTYPGTPALLLPERVALVGIGFRPLGGTGAVFDICTGAGTPNGSCTKPFPQRSWPINSTSCTNHVCTILIDVTAGNAFGCGGTAASCDPTAITSISPDDQSDAMPVWITNTGSGLCTPLSCKMYAGGVTSTVARVGNQATIVVTAAVPDIIPDSAMTCASSCGTLNAPTPMIGLANGDISSGTCQAFPTLGNGGTSPCAYTDLSHGTGANKVCYGCYLRQIGLQGESYEGSIGFEDKNGQERSGADHVGFANLAWAYIIRSVHAQNGGPWADFEMDAGSVWTDCEGHGMGWIQAGASIRGIWHATYNIGGGCNNGVVGYVVDGGRENLDTLYTAGSQVGILLGSQSATSGLNILNGGCGATGQNLQCRQNGIEFSNLEGGVTDTTVLGYTMIEQAQFTPANTLATVTFAANTVTLTCVNTDGHCTGGTNFPAAYTLGSFINVTACTNPSNNTLPGIATWITAGGAGSTTLSYTNTAGVTGGTCTVNPATWVTALLNNGSGHSTGADNQIGLYTYDKNGNIIREISTSTNFPSTDGSAYNLMIAAGTTLATATCTGSTAVPGMAWPMLANKNYRLSCDLPLVLTGAATAAVCLNGPAGPISYNLDLFGALGAAGAWQENSLFNQTSYLVHTPASAAFAGTQMSHVAAEIQNGSTASSTNLTLQISNVAASGTVQVGANAACTFQQMN
jgi:hypothetical protein